MEKRHWWRGLFGRRRAVPLDRGRSDLVVVAESFDDAEACSRALDRAAESEPRWTASAEAVLRHHLRVPADRREWLVGIAAQTGYTEASTDAVAAGGAPAYRAVPADVDAGLVALVVQRTEVLDAVHCSQERSRMAGLAQRAGGWALGWDALQPPQDRAGGTD
ncbi:hypothetical protein [Rhodococcus kronopolitis]|uniref:Uncharacterized protein n=1 Tax=Rhodococcus kronopolitis TaxID=1460226 RepID=A0ABV9FKC6_9NOCA